MTERPILFSAPMIQALLAGRKTQTRRLAKPRGRNSILGDNFGSGRWDDSFIIDPGNREWLLDDAPCRPGDTLYVREAFSGPWACNGSPPRDWPTSSLIWYWADGNPTEGDWTKPKPAMHMPRWASRISLEVADVRIERLTECSEEDARAEGVVYDEAKGWFHVPGVDHPNKDFPVLARSTARGMYAALWDNLHGSGAWLANPLVWAISFKVLA